MPEFVDSDSVPALFVLITIWVCVFIPTTVIFARLKRTRPKGLYRFTWAIASAVLVAGLWVYHHYFGELVSLLNFSGWQWALAVFITLQAIQYSLTAPGRSPRENKGKDALELLRFIVIIGLAEELWFRGIWFAMCHNHFVTSVLLGSFVFGLYHLRHGRHTATITFFVGLVFASARYRGASIISLALVHGVIDWLNCQMFPASRLRIREDRLLVFMALGCILAAAAILMWKNPLV